jgi:prepilin-type processing-associated H-X9-DG protein
VRTFNLTTIRYGINQVNGWSGDCVATGVCDNYGSNNPLRSPHPGGVSAAFCDGSVRFLATSTTLTVLAALADRNDGQVVSVP